jgi:hypothetical protein
MGMAPHIWPRVITQHWFHIEGRKKPASSVAVKYILPVDLPSNIFFGISRYSHLTIIAVALFTAGTFQNPMLNQEAITG